ncbi:MAG: GAF domain-containing protein, partial [Cyanobacteria bacterium J083]
YQHYKLAFETQDELIRSLAIIGEMSQGNVMTRSILLQSTKIFSELTEAEECSIFLLNSAGVVIESMLARGSVKREEERILIGEILDKGLAGWVVSKRQVGLIQDTMKDDRWLNLPYQPYSVRSALCVPILKASTLIGILTLTHSQPQHFSQETGEILAAIGRSLALMLDNILAN